MKTSLKNTQRNRLVIEALKTVNETEWEGETRHTTIETCLAAVKIGSNNSGWYNPTGVTLSGLNGIFMVNEDGSLFFDTKIIKESDNSYRIVRMTISAYNLFEQKYISLM